MKEFVILVDPSDHELGIAEKMEAHEKALLHRAFSVFIFNEKDELLLQQRALVKYHSGGKWTNTCCGHPRPGESTADAAARRLFEEMGIRCALEHRFDFTYKAALDNQLTEHEFDHVYFGWFTGPPRTEPAEVMNWEWKDLQAIFNDMEKEPEKYTEWFKLCFGRVLQVYEAR